MFYDPCKLRMLANTVANLTNVLQMKRENDGWVTNLHQTHWGVSLCLISASLCPISLFSFKFVLIVLFCPAFYGNVKTNASKSLQTSYDQYKCLANNKNGLRMVTNMSEWLQICCEYAFLTNFRSMFLIFVTPQNRVRMLTKAYECLAITLRSLRIVGELHL